MARIDAIVLGAGIVGTSIGAAPRQARAGRCAGRPARAGRGDLLRQCRHHRRQHALPARVSVGPCWRCCASRSSARRKPIIIWASCRRSRRGCSRFAPPRRSAAAVRDRARDAAVVRARDRGARGTDGRSRRRAAICARRAGSSSTAATRTFAALERELALAQEFGIAFRVLDTDAARELEPSLAPVFRHAVHWEGVASVTNPLAVTRAYAARFAALGGVVMQRRRALAASRRRTLADRYRRRAARRGSRRWWRSGPFAPDLLDAARHQAAARRSSAAITGTSGPRAMPGSTRPVLDADVGYCLAPMEQGIRLTTGAEFAARDAPPTPVQLERVLPAAKRLFPLGEPVEATPWMGSRPCFAGFTAGDRPRARAARPVARLWPRPLGADARPRDRAAHGRDDDRRDAVLRPRALCGGAVRAMSLPAVRCY